MRPLKGRRFRDCYWNVQVMRVCFASYPISSQLVVFVRRIFLNWEVVSIVYFRIQMPDAHRDHVRRVGTAAVNGACLIMRGSDAHAMSVSARTHGTAKAYAVNRPVYRRDDHDPHIARPDDAGPATGVRGKNNPARPG